MRSKTFHENYREELKLFQTIWIKFWMGLFFITLVLLPFFGDPYIIYLINLSGISVIAAMGLNLLIGFTGQISLGHAGFFAIGAYTAAFFATTFKVPFLPAMLLAGILAAIAGAIVGIPCLRLRGLYLAMATMSFGVVIEYIVINWESVTRGVRGISIPKPTILGMAFDNDRKFYFLILFIVILMVIIAKNIVRTKVGRAFVAIRDRDIAAEVIGVDLTKYKVLSFVISSFYGGVAGCLYSYYVSYVHPEHFNLLLSIEYIAMIIVGGLGTILGSILGAIFITIVPDLLKIFAVWLGKMIPGFAGKYDENWNLAMFGILIILFLIFEPGGFNAIWRRIKVSFKNWPFTY